MISIIDYGLCNVRSVASMLRSFGVESNIVKTPKEVLAARKLILPGVGAFDAAVKNLQEMDLFESINEMVIERKTPVLGICLGMQLMCQSSEEGKQKGFAWFDAQVKKFCSQKDGDIKIPHMGWNTVQTARPNSAVRSTSGRPRFYFVHSYYAECADERDVILNCTFGTRTFTAAFAKNNIVGCQFHPEKSHKFGKEFLKNVIVSFDEP